MANRKVVKENLIGTDMFNDPAAYAAGDFQSGWIL
jgi:hypothetical protein